MKYVNYILGLGVVILVIILIAYFVPKVANSPTNNPPTTAITDFDSCAAKYPVRETYPEQCVDPTTGKTYTRPTAEAEVVLATPMLGALVTSPLTVSGKAQNSWFFEANLPVSIEDANGQVLGQKGFMATTDWMVEGYVDFSGTLTFVTPTTTTGVLVIHNDNPSGLPENDKSYRIPVRFK